MGLVYEDGVEHSESGSAAHALELAHAAKLNLESTRAAHGALPHRAPSTRCTADLVHRVWHRCPTPSLAALAAQETTWGIGESSVVGPEPHRRTGLLPGMGFVAVAGPSAETTGVLKIDPCDARRSENMLRFAQAAVELMVHLQTKAS